jgi:DNA polymerase
MVDFECRSFLDVTKVGAWRYAEDWTTEVMCMAWKIIGTDKRGLWKWGEPFPQEVLDHIEAGGAFEAHNVQFERSIWMMILNKQLDIPMPKKWKDTLAVCAYRGLPLALDKAGAALGLPVQKSKDGKYLIKTLCSPKFGTKKEPDRIYREDPDLLGRFYDYCEDDVDSEECLGEAIGELPTPEYRLWILDQTINQRGVMLDLDVVEAALTITEKVAEKLNAEMAVITDGAVTAATQVAKLLKWCQGQDMPLLDNLQKETLADILKTDANGDFINAWKFKPTTIRALEIRQILAKASVKKLETMLGSVNRDGRVRGLLQYHGAGTGRWAGRLVQPQNFPRATLKVDMERLVSLIMEGDPDLLDFLFGNAMEVVSNALRGMIIPAPGKVFRVCDFSAIEARVTFWVANCQTGLDVFHSSDRGECEDIYCVTASDLVGFEVLKKKHGKERQLGKITVLGCGYQMGWSRLQEQAEVDYKVFLDDDEAQRMVNLYRHKYKEVKWLWYGLEEAAIEAVQTGKTCSYNMITFEVVNDNAGEWLTIILPNGRRLWYLAPQVNRVKFQWPSGDWAEKDQLSYMGRDNKRGGNWTRVKTYGGMITENVVQAIARDLMAEAMIRVEMNGYRIVMTVHDEIISEDDPDYGSMTEFEELMSLVPPWAAGCPVAVEGGEITRYQKI